MIKEYVDAWFRNRDKLKKYFETHTQEQYGQNYTDMLKTIIKVIINDPEEILDETRIIERDLTDYYQGDYIWLIPRKNEYYDEPTVVDCVFCYVKYGSCCGCDTLMGIYEGFGEDNQWGEGLLTSERRVKDYMYLSLQLLQNMKPLMTLEEARQNYEIKYEDYMK